MATYRPIYEFFSSWEAFVNGSPTRIASGDRAENLISAGSFNYSKAGGCLDGSLSCQYELTTLIKKGWFFLARTHADGPAVYSGRVVSFDHKLSGEAKILVFGFLRWFNDFTLDDEIFVGQYARDVVAYLADRVRHEIRPYFRIKGISTGTFEGNELDGARVFTQVPAYSSIRREIDRIAAIAGDVFFGFFDGGEVGFSAFSGELDPLTYQVLQGSPPLGRRVSIGRDVLLNRFTENDANVINSVHLFGATPAYSWSLDDWSSIEENGLSRRWLQKADLVDDKVARDIMSFILARGTESRTTVEISIPHSERSGDPTNLVESGIPFPWKERLQVTDNTAAGLVTNRAAREITVNMGSNLSVDVTIGDSEGNLDDELERLFGVEISDKPFAPKTFFVGSTRESVSVYTSLKQAPIGIPLVQRTGLGLVAPSIAANRYNSTTTLSEVGDSTRTSTNARSVTYAELIKTLGGAAIGTPHFTDLGLNEVKFATYVDADGDRQAWNNTSGIWDWAYKNDELGLSYQSFVMRKYRSVLLDENSIIDAQQNTPHFRQDGLPWLDQVNAASRDAALPLYGISRQIPHSLSLHLQGTMKGLQDGAIAAGYSLNFLWVINALNVFAHYVERFPYDPTFDVVGDSFPGSGFAYYFTEPGAVEAVSAGFFYEPVISLVGTVPDPVDFNPDASGRDRWSIIDYLATTPFIRAASGSLQVPGLESLPDSTFTAKMTFVKRTITSLDRISPTAYRSPEPSETSVSKEYGLPRFRAWEWIVDGYDTDYTNNFE